MRYQKTFTIFISYFFLFLAQITDIQAQSVLTEKADSLFSTKEYQEASKAYQELLEKHDINKENAYLKLAYIAEQSGNFAQSIYFLSELYEINPSDKVFDKINRMAKENGFGGYERSEINFLLTLYYQYYAVFVILLVLLTSFLFYYFWNRKSSNKVVPKRYAFLLLALITLALFVVNIPSTYKLGIIKAQEAFMRDSPSSGSENLGSIGEGNRVNIIGKKDIWYQIVWQRKVIYIKESDLWVVNS